MTRVNKVEADGLIARLEKLSGPDRSVGNDVLLACGWTNNEYGFGPSRFLEWVNPDPNGIDYHDGNQPDPTASLDAARMLANGFYWIASEGRTRDNEPLGCAQIFQKNYLTKPVAEAEHEFVEIALCIAILRARSTPCP